MSGGWRWGARTASLAAAVLLVAACSGDDQLDATDGSTPVSAVVLGEAPDASTTTRAPVQPALTTVPPVAPPSTGPITTQPSLAGAPTTAAAAPVTSAASAITTVPPQAPASSLPPSVEAPSGDTAAECGFVEPDETVVPLATSCGGGMMLSSFYRPAEDAYGADLWSLRGDAWVLAKTFETGCPSAAELADAGAPDGVAAAWGPAGSCRTDGEPFPHPSFLEVPQLGQEDVRGSGCGASSSIGERIPDGIWSVRVAELGATEMRVDLTCIHYGSEARRLSQAAGGVVTDVWFEVNNSNRLRTVALDPGFQLRLSEWNESGSRCEDTGRPARPTDSDVWTVAVSWLVVDGGSARLLQVACPFG